MAKFRAQYSGKSQNTIKCLYHNFKQILLLKIFLSSKTEKRIRNLFRGWPRARLSDENHSLRPTSTSTAASSGPAFPASSHVPRKSEIAPLCFMNGDSSRRQSRCQLSGYSEFLLHGLSLPPRRASTVYRSLHPSSLPLLPSHLARMIKSLVYISLCKQNKICYHQRLDLSSAYFAISLLILVSLPILSSASHSCYLPLLLYIN